MAEITYRPLITVDDLRRVADVERDVWNVPDEEVVPASLLAVSVKCGAFVIGAFDGDDLVGFVYSFPGRRRGRAIHWSHMLGVRPRSRSSGIGRALKLRQREMVRADGYDLIEWTFDPLQAVNAGFNLSGLGATCGEYLEDVYGELAGPLHRGAPTDRLVAEWRLDDASVRHLARGEARVERGGRAGGEIEGPVVNPLRRDGAWWTCAEPAVLDGLTEHRIAIPGEFTRMLADAPALALRWRLLTRGAFERAFRAGLVACAFEPHLASGGGYYVMKETGSG